MKLIFFNKAIINSLIFTIPYYVVVAASGGFPLVPDQGPVTDPSSVHVGAWENVKILDCSSADKKTGKFPEAAEFDNLVRMYFRSNFGNGGQSYLSSNFPSCLGGQLNELDAATVKQLNWEIKAIIRTFNGQKSFFDRHFRKFKKYTDVRYRVHRLMGILEYFKNNQSTIGDEKKSPIKRIRFHSQFRFSKARKSFDVKLNDFKNLARNGVGVKIGGIEQLKFPEIVQVGLQKIGRLVWDEKERDPTHVETVFELLKLGLSNANSYVNKKGEKMKMTTMTEISLAIIQQTMASGISQLTDEQAIERLKFIWDKRGQSGHSKSYGELLDDFVAQQFENRFETICSEEILSEWKKQVESGFDGLKLQLTKPGIDISTFPICERLDCWNTHPFSFIGLILHAFTMRERVLICDDFETQKEVLTAYIFDSTSLRTPSS